MKKLISTSLFLGLLLLLSCQQQDIQIKKEKLAKVAYSSLDKEEKLANALKGISISVNKGGRIMNVLENINSDSILKVLQSDSASYTFTMRLKNDNNRLSFKNLVFRRTLNGFVGFLLEYESPVEQSDLSKYTGVVKKYDLEGKLLQELSLKNGTINSSKGGRTASCTLAGFSKSCAEQIFDGWDHTTGAPIFKCGRFTVFITFDCYDYAPSEPPTAYGTFVADYRPSGGVGGIGGVGGGVGSVSNIQGNYDRNTEFSTFDPGDPMGVWPPPTSDEIFKILTDELIGNLTSVNLLDVLQNDHLRQAFNEVYKKCPNKFFIDALNENGFKFKFKIDASMTTPGGFDPATNSIKFRSTNDVNFDTLQEELFHAYQHLNSSTLTQLTSPYIGRSNIEFESKVYHDVICYVTGSFPCALWGSDSDEYSTWIREITDDWTKFPTWDKMQGKYYKFLEEFVIYNPNYNFPIDYNLKPTAVFKATNGC
jgi:hypothetical protein